LPPDNVTIKNSVLDGSSTALLDTRPFSAVAGTEGLSVTGQRDPRLGGRRLSDQRHHGLHRPQRVHETTANGVVTESVDTQIANNTFSNPTFAGPGAPRRGPLPFCFDQHRQLCP